MKQETVRITDCNRCPYREAETDEYPSDFCGLSGHHLTQNTTAPYDRPIPVPSSCHWRRLLPRSTAARYGIKPEYVVDTTCPICTQEYKP